MSLNGLSSYSKMISNQYLRMSFTKDWTTTKLPCLKEKRVIIQVRTAKTEASSKNIRTFH